VLAQAAAGGELRGDRCDRFATPDAMSGKADLLEQLKRSPDDWPSRFELMEFAMRAGDVAEARRLVRESPSDQPTPPEWQARIHALFTKGPEPRGDSSDTSLEGAASRRSTVEPVPPRRTEGAPVASGSVEAVPPRSEKPTVEPVPPRSGKPAVEPVPPRSGKPAVEPVPPRSEKPAVEPVPPRSGKPAVEPVPPRSEKPTVEPVPPRREAGGFGGVDSEEHLAAEEAPVSEPPLASKPLPPAPRIRTEAAREKWEKYHGAFALAPVDAAPRATPPSTTSERFSSVSLAVVFHLLLLLLVSVVAVSVPRVAPPELVVSAHHERESEILAPTILPDQLEVSPADAAAAQALDVVTAIDGVSLPMPEVEHRADEILPSLLPGLETVGMGLNLSTDSVTASNVNFFGISGRGRNIVFVIDATPFMLVDEKGGMDAYDKVKDEIAAMLAGLNRGTKFNILLYDQKRLAAFREEPVPGLPSNLRMAMQWLEPLNRDYEALGLRGAFAGGPPLEVTDYETLPIRAGDIAHYTKAIQKAMEWQASTIFCIVSGYRAMPRAPTPEMMERIRAAAASRGQVNEREQRAWDAAVERTREWLRGENDARRARGLSPKVVTNFNQLVREVTGATPPRRTGGSGDPPPSMPAVTPEDVDAHLRRLVSLEYRDRGLDAPSLHMVLFLGKDERVSDDEDHFRRLVRRNQGQLKILRGLGALENVTGKR